MRYICVDCNYETDRLSSYQKHLITQKHLLKSNKQHVKVPVIPIRHQKKSEKICKCTYCNKYYSNSSSLARHKKICTEKETIEISHINEIEKRDQEYIRLK